MHTKTPLLYFFGGGGGRDQGELAKPAQLMALKIANCRTVQLYNCPNDVTG